MVCKYCTDQCLQIHGSWHNLKHHRIALLVFRLWNCSGRGSICRCDQILWNVSTNMWQFQCYHSNCPLQHCPPALVFLYSIIKFMDSKVTIHFLLELIFVMSTYNKPLQIDNGMRRLCFIVSDNFLCQLRNIMPCICKSFKSTVILRPSSTVNLVNSSVRTCITLASNVEFSVFVLRKSWQPLEQKSKSILSCVWQPQNTRQVIDDYLKLD